MAILARIPITCGYLVKNEEAFLEASLKAIAEWATELIILDTGSTDRSLEIARSFEAKLPEFCLHQVPWTDDFSEMRNKILDLAKNDWVLFVDGDEIIDSEAPLKLADAMKEETSCYSLIQRNYTYREQTEACQLVKELPPGLEKMDGLYFFDNWMERFVRKSSGLRYEGRIHESLIPAAIRKGLECKKLPLVFHHHGRLKDINFEEKSNYYLKLTKKKLEEQPELAASWLEYSVNLMELGRFKEALQIALQGLKKFPKEKEILRVAIQASLRAEDYSLGEKLIEDLLALDPGNLFALEQRTTAVLYQGRLDDCLEHSRHVFENDPNNFVAHVNAGVVYFEKQDWKNAARHLQSALRLRPNDAFLLEAVKKVPAEFFKH